MSAIAGRAAQGFPSVNLRENNHNVDTSCCECHKSNADQAVASKIFLDGRYVQLHTIHYASVGPRLVYAENLAFRLLSY